MNVKIGAGKYDVTGPCAEVGFMGYFDTKQKGKGLYSRLYSRAFVIEDLDNNKSVAIVSVDICMSFQAVHLAVLKKLADNGFEDIYTVKNVLISSTHTHGAPGGNSHSIIYNGTTPGFNKQNFDCIVEGVFQSIVLAHNNKKPGKILVAKGDVEDCGGNRSSEAYNKNPAGEIALYGSEVDKEMTLLKFVADNGDVIGSINWFAVHGTNMGQTNLLISSDNKGYGQWLFEGDKGCISAFANSNCGDVSPNMKYCLPDGENDFDRMKEFGTTQYEKAVELFDNAADQLTGSIDYRQTYVDMTCVNIEGETDERTWPAAFGLGMVSGSTEDSTGVPIWPEGYTKEDLENDYNLFRRGLGEMMEMLNKTVIIPPFPVKKYIKGQAEKPLLMAVGLAEFLCNPLISQVMPLQLIKLGSLVLIGHPGEITTMAGRRLRKSILDVLESDGINHAVIVSYANAYGGYTTTREEYAEQHYEGASTMFGPWTLKAHQQEFAKLAQAIKKQTTVPPGPQPPDMSANEIFALPNLHFFDLLPHGKNFGEVITQPKESYNTEDTVNVQFYGAYPNNDLRTNDTYLKVEKKENGQWQTVYTDKDFCTEFHWKIGKLPDRTALPDLADTAIDFDQLKNSLDKYLDYLKELEGIPGIELLINGKLSACKKLKKIFKAEKIEDLRKFLFYYSIADIYWNIPENQEPGTYRMTYYGNKKELMGKITPIEGESNQFTVTA